MAEQVAEQPKGGGPPVPEDQRQARIDAIVGSTTYAEARDKLLAKGFDVGEDALARFGQRLGIQLKPTVGTTARMAQRLQLAEGTVLSIAEVVKGVLPPANEPGKFNPVAVSFALGKIDEMLNGYIRNRKELDG